MTNARRAGSHAVRGALLAIAVTAGATSPAAAAAATGLPAAWGDWRASAPLSIATTPSGGYVRVPLPQSVDPGPDGDYADLRVIDDLGHETPYAIDPDAPDARAAAIPLPLSDTGFVRGRYSQAVADAGETGTLHDAVTIVTPRSTFFVRASLEASDDRRVWRELMNDTTLYRVAGNGDPGNQTIVFPSTRSRWLRIRVYDARDPFRIDGIEIARAARAPKPLEPLTATIAESTSSEAHSRQRFVLDLGTPNVAVDAIRMDGANGFFSRAVSVETSADGTTWTEAGSDRIERFAEGGAHTGFAIDEAHGRYVRITIDNGNDAPLAHLHPALLARSRDLVFAPQSGRTYALAFHNRKASPPVYDLAARLARESWTATRTARAGPVLIAPDADTRGFLERYPWVVTTAFAIAGIALALFAVQTVRGARREP